MMDRRVPFVPKLKVLMQSPAPATLQPLANRLNVDEAASGAKAAVRPAVRWVATEHRHELLEDAGRCGWYTQSNPSHHALLSTAATQHIVLWTGTDYT